MPMLEPLLHTFPHDIAHHQAADHVHPLKFAVHCNSIGNVADQAVSNCVLCNFFQESDVSAQC